jgi:hypothetical protein
MEIFTMSINISHPGVLVTVMQKVPLSKLLKYHGKSHKKSVTH